MNDPGYGRRTSAFVTALYDDAFRCVKRMMDRGEKIGDIHPGRPIRLQGTFSGPELEAIMTLMAASEVRSTPHASP